MTADTCAGVLYKLIMVHLNAQNLLKRMKMNDVYISSSRHPFESFSESINGLNRHYRVVIKADMSVESSIFLYSRDIL